MGHLLDALGTADRLSSVSLSDHMVVDVADLKENWKGEGTAGLENRFLPIASGIGASGG